MSLQDEVYVMSFLYESLSKYIEYCERKHRDFNQENFVLITQKFIQNLSPHEKGFIQNTKYTQEKNIPVVQPVIQDPVPQIVQPPQVVQQTQPVSIANVRYNPPQPQVIEKQPQVVQQQTNLSQSYVTENTRVSATSQRLNSFSTLLSKRQT